VFLAGWHGHDELPDFLSASDVVVLPSVREQFGQVLVEGMACGLPADRGGRLRPGGDRRARGDGLARAAGRRHRADERAGRGRQPAGRARTPRPAARDVALERYAWPALAGRVAQVYATALGAPEGEEGVLAGA
jgi:glycosyltransferase involved in cell wall biosynthesis